METHQYDGLDKLTDYVYLILARLLKNGRRLSPEQREVLREARRGEFGPLVAMALEQMAQDMFSDEDERPTVPAGRLRALDEETAVRLKKEHGSLRVAARAAGCSPSAFHRALTGNYGKVA